MHNLHSKARTSRGCALRGSALVQHVQRFRLQMGVFMYNVSREFASEWVCYYTACVLNIPLNVAIPAQYVQKIHL